MMEKRGSWVFWISISLVVMLIIAAFFWFILFKPNKTVYHGDAITNPIANLTMEEAIMKFDESFVFYLLYSIEAYNLHNPPLSKDIPRMEIVVGEDIFNAVVNAGAINVGRGHISKKDIVIRTTKEEAVKMIKDINYVTQSFNDGKSSIELVAPKTTLFAKGYLNLYNRLTGKSVTGNVIRIYLE